MKEFLKYTFASVVGNILSSILVVSLGVGGLIAITVVTSSKTPEVPIKDKSVLVLDLSLNIRDTQGNPTANDIVTDVLSEDEPDKMPLKRVLDSLERAKNDPKIVGIYLKGSSDLMSIGLANQQEIRLALQRFKESKKPIFAYDINWSKSEYYLASVANTIAMSPMGNMEFNGLNSEMMFLGGAFEKFGIGAQVTRVGKYKSAVEPFLLQKMSPENREQIQKLLGDVWNGYINTIASARKLTPAQLQQIANTKGILTSEDAIAAKLVDKIAYSDQIEAELKKLTGKKETDDSFEEISLYRYAKIVNAPQKESLNTKNRIAVIYAEGEIVDGDGGRNQIGSDRVIKEFRKVRLDNNIKAVVVRVNSPGGSATASELIGREVTLTREKKPVIISMGNLAASGGYWIAMGGNRIFAESNTITGSIGVFGLLLNVQKLANNNGITWDNVKTSPLADLNTTTRPKTAQELAIIQEMVDRTYTLFTDKVAQFRKLPLNKVQEIAQGRIWSGIAAKNLGLVDEIGGLNSAIKAAAKEAKLGDTWQVDEYPKVRSWEEKLLDKLSGTPVSKNVTPVDPLTASFKKLQGELTILKSLNDPRGIYTRLPFTLEIR